MYNAAPSHEGFYAETDSHARLNPNFREAALGHASTLHPESGRGNVVLARKDEGRWDQRSYPIAELPEVIPLYAGQPDSYITQQRYAFRRTVSQLVELQAMFAELDFYNVPELRGMDARGVLEDILILLEDEQIPYPSLVIYSGRGLHLIWLHSPVPREALPRWIACQEHLGRALRAFGWDRGAKDGARVLRLARTVNSKSGEVVEEIRGIKDRYDFETLCSEILPLGRAELRDIRVKRAEKDARMPPETRQRPARWFTQAGLAEARITDLQRLRSICWFGDLPPGQRDYWLFVAATSMSWLIDDLQALQREMFALAKEAGKWDGRESRSRLSAVMKRARMAADGQTVQWGGTRVDARYRFRNETIIELLEITAEEEREMVTLISKDERLRRHRETDMKRRREVEGKVPREKYTATAEQRKIRAGELRARGMTQREIAGILGCSQQEVSRLIKGLDKRIQGCAPLYGRDSHPVGSAFGEEHRQPTGNDAGEIEEIPELRGVEEDSMSGLKSSPPNERPDHPERIPSAEEPRRAWEEVDGHPLTCGCVLCSATAPSYVRYS